MMLAMPTKSIVGEQLEELLQAKNWSAAELARQSGVNESTISNIISGKRPSPRGDTVRKLADAAGVPVDVLYGRTGAIVGEVSQPLPEYAMQVVERMRELDANYNRQLLLFAEAMVAEQEEMRLIDAIAVMHRMLDEVGKGEEFTAIESLLRRLESAGRRGISSDEQQESPPED